jgi:hypothetical protein
MFAVVKSSPGTTRFPRQPADEFAFRDLDVLVKRYDNGERRARVTSPRPISGTEGYSVWSLWQLLGNAQGEAADESGRKS